MPGTLTIPNPQSGLSGNVPAIQLDQNWDAIKNYINAREITIGTLGSRPAPSVSGRFYFATDTAQLFTDTGTAWLAVGVSSGQGMWGLRRPIGAPNTVTPLTQYDLSADVVQLRNPTTGQVVTVMNPGVRTNNILTAGPAVNGRDQAGAFSANSYVHLYHVYDGTTLATISSLAAPTVGPTLPGGYTSFSYFNTLRLNASTQFLPTRMVGAWVYYVGGQSVLSGGLATSPTAVDVSGFVPSSSMRYQINDSGWAVNADGAGLLVADLEIHLVSGTIFAYMARPALGAMAASSSARTQVGLPMVLPNLGQQFFYKWTITNGSAPSANITVSAYSVPNGGE